MKNMVKCKICKCEFEYSPGFAGNARQICDDCREEEDNAELEALKEKIILESNKYLLGAPKRDSEYDPIEILFDKNIPEFKSDKERFICAQEIGEFVNNVGLHDLDDSLIDLFKKFDLVHIEIFLNKLDEEKRNIVKNKILGDLHNV